MHVDFNTQISFRFIPDTVAYYIVKNIIYNPTNLNNILIVYTYNCSPNSKQLHSNIKRLIPLKTTVIQFLDAII